MCTYLLPRGRRYYFRRFVPIELRPFILTATGKPRSEWLESLHTSDRATAKRLIPALTLRTEAELDAARQRLPGSTTVTPPPIRIKRRRTPSGPSSYDVAAMAYFEREADDRECRFDARAIARDEFERRIGLYPTEELSQLEQVARDLIRQANHQTALADDQRMIAGARLQELKAALPPPLPPEEARTVGTTLEAVVAKWAAERRVTAKSRDTYSAAVRWFHQRVGLVAIEQIIRKDILTFKDKMLAEGTGLSNAGTKLSRIAALLSYALANDLIATNPALGIRVVDSDAAKRKRLGFDAKDLATLFGGPVHAKGERPIGGKGEAAYWLPLLALYTGARLEELGQLRPGDITRETYLDIDDAEHSAWAINIVEDEEDKLSVKNAPSIRVVPVHRALIELGFIAYVEAAKARGDAKVFPILKPDKYGKDTAKFGEWFTDYRRNVCGLTDRRLVFHSFRHAFADNARHSGMSGGAQRKIMGHSGVDVNDTYGSGHGFYRLVEAMKLYRVPGFTLPAPPTIVTAVID
jgi:integrase